MAGLTRWIAVGMFAALTAGLHAAEKTPPGARPIFASPEAAYQAWCEATARGDWKTAFCCWTPKWQEHLVFEAYFSCQMHDPAKVAPLLKRFGAEAATIDAAYYRAYQQEHGVDLAALVAQREAKRAAATAAYLKGYAQQHPQAARGADVAIPVPGLTAGLPPLPPDDPDLYRQTVVATIRDPAGFYDATCRLVLAGAGREIYGPLEKMTRSGDRAVGVASTKLSGLSSRGPGAPTRRFEQGIPATFTFCKLHGTWLLETRK